jgi:hypothetical protein
VIVTVVAALVEFDDMNSPIAPAGALSLVDVPGWLCLNVDEFT